MRHLASQASVGYTPADPDDLLIYTAAELLEVRRLQNEHMTDEEKALPSFTRKNVMKLKNWLQWRDADDKQLNSHYESGALGKAVSRPKKVDGKPSQVFCAVWNHLVKPTGD